MRLTGANGAAGVHAALVLATASEPPLYVGLRATGRQDPTSSAGELAAAVALSEQASAGCAGATLDLGSAGDRLAAARAHGALGNAVLTPQTVVPVGDAVAAADRRVIELAGSRPRL